MAAGAGAGVGVGAGAGVGWVSLLPYPRHPESLPTEGVHFHDSSNGHPQGESGTGEVCTRFHLHTVYSVHLMSKQQFNHTESLVDTHV